MNKIIEGAEEAIAIVTGEAPAARLTVNGHSYVPEVSMPDQINALTDHLREIIRLTKEGYRNVDDFVRDMDQAYLHARAALLLVTMPRAIPHHAEG